MKAGVSQCVCVVAPLGETQSKYFHCETQAGVQKSTEADSSLSLYCGEKKEAPSYQIYFVCLCHGCLSVFAHH